MSERDDYRVVRETAKLVERRSAWATRIGLALVALITSAALALVGAVGYLVWDTRRDNQDQAEELEKRAKAEAFGNLVILCVLDELGELRGSAEAHYRDAEKDTERPVRPGRPSLEDQATPEVAEELERACQPVLDELRKQANGEEKGP